MFFDPVILVEQPLQVLTVVAIIVLGKPVVVQLNSGAVYKGVLACLDGFMNIAMEQTEEYIDGHLKNKYGDCFIRGNNVMYISSAKRK